MPINLFSTKYMTEDPRLNWLHKNFLLQKIKDSLGRTLKLQGVYHNKPQFLYAILLHKYVVKRSVWSKLNRLRETCSNLVRPIPGFTRLSFKKGNQALATYGHYNPSSFPWDFGSSDPIEVKQSVALRWWDIRAQALKQRFALLYAIDTNAG
ncbi:hypothetical protein BDV11DRAFT_115530 [Aspergillus similis]